MFHSRHRADLLVAAVCLIAVFGFLGRREIDGVRERRIAGSAADIDNNGHWLIPYLQGRPRFLKPLLADWLAAGSMRLFGRSELTFRLPTAFAAAGAIAAGCWLARRLISPEAGRTAALLMAGSLYFVSESHSVCTDILLTCFSGCAMLAWWHWQREERPYSRAWWCFYLSIGAGCLSKGPVALVIVAIPIVLELWASRRWPLAMRLRPWQGLAVVFAMALPWPIAVCMHIPDALAFWAVDATKSLATKEKGIVWDYFSHLSFWPYFAFPWTVLGLAALALPLFRGKLAAWPAIRFCYFWLVGDLVFFCTWAAQPMHYLLPLAVPLAVIEAALWRHAAEQPRLGVADRAATMLRWGVLLGVAVFAVATAAMLHLRTPAGPIWTFATLVVAAVPIILAARWLKPKPDRAFAAMAIVAVGLVAVFTGRIRPDESFRESCAAFGRELTNVVPASEPVFFTNTEEALPFYAVRDFRRIELDDPGGMLESLGAGYLLLSRDALTAHRPYFEGRVQTDLLMDGAKRRPSGKDLLLVRFESTAPRTPPRDAETPVAGATPKSLER